MLAVGVLLDFMNDLGRAKTFATQVDEKRVWSKLGKAQLDHGHITDAIDSFILAKDPSEYAQICTAANDAGIWLEVIPYLQMARLTLQENLVHTELIHAFALIE